MISKIYYVLIMVGMVVILMSCEGRKSENGDLENGESVSSMEPDNNRLQDDSDDASNKAAISIQEDTFFAQIETILLNYQDYLGQTIELDGIFLTYTDDVSGDSYYSVFRYGPEEKEGFEIAGDFTVPEEYTWVHVKGVLSMYREGSYKHIILKNVTLQPIEVKVEGISCH